MKVLALGSLGFRGLELCSEEALDPGRNYILGAYGTLNPTLPAVRGGEDGIVFVNKLVGNDIPPSYAGVSDAVSLIECPSMKGDAFLHNPQASRTNYIKGLGNGLELCDVDSREAFHGRG